MNRIANSRFLSKIDLTQGYYQVRIKSKDVEKTAFNTRQGKFEFLVMPFDLSNAPATFQTLMNDTLRVYLDDFVIVYLDDIVVFFQIEEDHCEHVCKVLKVLEKANLYAKTSKCEFGVSSLEFCGHRVGSGRIEPLQDKVNVILE